MQGMSQPAELLVLLSLLVIPVGIVGITVAVVRRRSVYQAWPTMGSVEVEPGDGAPIACGLRMRSPGSYLVLYPLAVCRVSPRRITLTLNKRGWSFDREVASACFGSRGFRSYMRLTSDGVVLDVWPLTNGLKARAAETGWLPVDGTAA